MRPQLSTRHCCGDVDLRASARHGSRHVITHTFPLGGPLCLITLGGPWGAVTPVMAVPVAETQRRRPSSTATHALLLPEQFSAKRVYRLC